MPLPTPNPGERYQQFMTRCMGDRRAVDEFPDQDVRWNVCRGKWDGKTESEEAQDGPVQPGHD